MLNISKISVKITVILCIIILLSGCIDTSDEENGSQQTIEDTLVVAFFDNVSINPFSLTAGNQLSIRPNLFNGLVEFDKDFKIIPALAESWNNPDEYTWRFYLRDDVKFHNGYDFTAEDVNFSIQELFIGISSLVDEIRIVDEYTIEIKTISPNPTFLSKLAQSFVVFSKDYFQEYVDYWPIGTGAYKLVEYVENNYTKFERFEDYWREKPSIKTVIYKLIESDDERIDQLISGSVDIAEYNVNDSIHGILENDNVKLVKFAPLSTYIIGFDLRQNNSYGFPNGENPTADVRVRKAIYHAIDIEPLINDPFQGLAIPASQFVTSYVFGYNPEIERLPYNVSKAKDLLADAGYEDGFEIELDCITELYDYNVENCELIAEQLSEIGINVSINGMSSEEFNRKVVREKNTSLWLVGWGTVSVDGGVVYDYFIRTVDGSHLGYYNSGHYSNLAVDLLGEKASVEMEPSIRLEYLQEGFKIAVEDNVIIVPLFSQELFLFSSDNVEIESRADLKIMLEKIYFK